MVTLSSDEAVNNMTHPEGKQLVFEWGHGHDSPNWVGGIGRRPRIRTQSYHQFPCDSKGVEYPLGQLERTGGGSG